ncbi:hypothetical protein [Xenorhabdus thailandensis]|uniref:hypothetical protein n=1 Tax=Xenorhabdus thailandensis TaxID=3136255 RepID=UPI0030F4797C
MANKLLHLSGIKSGWNVSYFFQTQTWNSYMVTIQDSITKTNYGTWVKTYEKSSIPHTFSGTFLYTGPDGKLTCYVECAEGNRLDNSWNSSLILPSSGEPTLGMTYCASFEDFSGSIDYNDFFVCLTGWSHGG